MLGKILTKCARTMAGAVIGGDRRKRQRGLFGGTAEQMPLIAGIAVITTIVVGAAGVALANSKSNSEWNAFSSVASAVQTMYQGELYPNGVLDATIIAESKYGNVRLNAAGTGFLNNSGGTLSCSGNGTNTFTCTTTALSVSACIDFLKSVPSIGWTSAQVNAAAAVTSFGISTATAKAQCTAAANTIVLSGS